MSSRSIIFAATLIGCAIAALPPAPVHAWTGAGLDTLPITALAVHPSLEAQVVVGTSGYGIFVTVNAGKDWQQAVPSGTINALLFDPQNPSVIYAGTAETGVLKSINGGRTFQAYTDGLSEYNIQALAIDSSQRRFIYVGTPNGCFQSVDQGRTWRGAGLQNQDVTALAITMLSGRPVVFAGTRNNGVFKSEDSGVIWRPVNEGLVSKSIRSLVTNPNQPGWVEAGTFDAGALESRDAGSIWQATASGLGIVEGVTIVGAVGSPDAPGFCQFAAGYDKQIYLRTETREWRKLGTSVPARVQCLGVRRLLPATLYAGTSRGLFAFGQAETKPPTSSPDGGKP
jgi:photosystem II stability/assembly factor-like uncharacterized protein